jgi:hypothetical protein
MTGYRPWMFEYRSLPVTARKIQGLENTKGILEENNVLYRVGFGAAAGS